MLIPIAIILALITGLFTEMFSTYDHGTTIFMSGFFWGAAQAVIVFLVVRFSAKKKNSL